MDTITFTTPNQGNPRLILVGKAHITQHESQLPEPRETIQSTRNRPISIAVFTERQSPSHPLAACSSPPSCPPQAVLILKRSHLTFSEV